MEETDVCNLTPTVLSVQQAIPHGCAAKNLTPSQRLTLGLHALAGTQSITDLADESGVSRKFVYQQADTAQTALEDAFTPADTADDEVLFYLPVTKNWLRQFALSLTLICHCSYRGVVELCRDLLDVPLSVGWVHNIVHAAIDKARPHNVQTNLAKVAYAGLDEIYQNRQPVFVAADIESTFCFLLSREDHCDGDTWGIRLLEAQDRGLAPQAVIADFGTAIHAGVQLALPAVPQRGDVFHGLAEITETVAVLERGAYQKMAVHHQLQQEKDKRLKQGRSASSLSSKIALADQAQLKAIDLADSITLLRRWLRHDVFAVSGLPYADRCAGYDFILAELQARAPLCPKKLDPADDFPDYAKPVAEAVSDGTVGRGVLTCGTGLGMSYAANRFPHVRAAVAWSPEIAELARKHNDANILVLPSRFVSEQEGLEILHKWLDTKFEGGRHQRRVEKIEK